MLVRSAATAALATLALTATAGAATITEDGGSFTYRAAPGEANRIVVVAEDPGELRISDDVPIAALPAGCRRADWDDETLARCPLDRPFRIETGDGDDHVSFLYELPAGPAIAVDGGPGDDELTGPGDERPVALHGGDGDDRLRAGRGGDLLEGGPGDDVLEGGNGDDRLLGGYGADELAGHDGADVLDGGAGIDGIQGDWLATGTDDEIPVRVTLNGKADDGRPGEGDDVEGVERIESGRPATLVAGAHPVAFKVFNTAPGPSELIGSRRDDVLTSYDDADVVHGRAGADVIEAGLGDDRVIGGPGRDTINADAGSGSCNFLVCRVGSGNDLVLVRDGERDSVRCGHGDDRVIADRGDVVAADCERVVRR